MIPRHWCYVILICIQLPSSAAEFSDARGWLHVNGYSWHFAANDANDRLLGAGATYYTGRLGAWHTGWEADVFQDSGRKLSAYAGRSWTRPTTYFSLGLTAAVMYHRNFAAQNSLRLLPVAFPFLETRGTRLKARLYYVPPVRSPSDHQVALQLLVPLFR